MMEEKKGGVLDQVEYEDRIGQFFRAKEHLRGSYGGGRLPRYMGLGDEARLELTRDLSEFLATGRA